MIFCCFSGDVSSFSPFLRGLLLGLLCYFFGGLLKQIQVKIVFFFFLMFAHCLLLRMPNYLSFS